MFCEEIIELLQEIPVALTKSVGLINKQQMLLTDIGGKWFMDKHKSKLPPMTSPRLIKEEKKKEENIRKT